MMNAKKTIDPLVQKIIEREHDGTILLADVARVAGVDPKAARARLRQLLREAKIKVPTTVEEGRWKYRTSKAARLLKLIKKQ